VNKSIVLAAALVLLGSGAAFAAAPQGYQSAQPDAKAKTKGGIVNTNGSIGYGSGFSVSHLGTGSYQIVFPNGTFKTCPVIALTGAGGNGDVPVMNLSNYGCSNGGLTIVVGIVSRTNGSLQDNAFHFVATPI
jgi:hypothetical protein